MPLVKRTTNRARVVTRTDSRNVNPHREGPLSEEEELRLTNLWRTKEDTAALGRLVASHMGLVIKIANEFRHSGPRIEDLIQEGNLGLTIAARRFDPNRKTRLSTYASYWIRACMLDLVVRSHGPVRIGTTRSQRRIFFGFGRARRQLESGGEVADAGQIAEVLGVERADVESMSSRLAGRDVSLDAPRSSEEGRPLGWSFAADEPDPEASLAAREQDSRRRALVTQGLKVLDSRERMLMRARHLRERPLTLAHLGKKLGISRERVRQLEVRATAKLRKFVEQGG